MTYQAVLGALLAITLVAGPARAQKRGTAPLPGAEAPKEPSTRDSSAEGEPAEHKGEGKQPLGCAEAYEQAQTEKLNGKYLRAGDLALACSQLECNPAIVRECVKLYEDIQAEVPTLVFSARLAGGGELVDVHIEMDGKPLLEKLDGKPVPLDPGAHRFRFKTPGHPPLEQLHTARVGDRNRLVEVVFEDPSLAKAAPAPAEPALSPANPPPEVDRSRGIPAGSFILAGIGVAGFGAFTYLNVSANQRYDELLSCRPNCPQDSVDELRTRFDLSYAALGVGAAGIVGAVAVYLFASGGSDTPPAQVGVAPLPGGASGQFMTRF